MKSNDYGIAVTEKIIMNGYGASGSLIGGKTLKPIEFERNPPRGGRNTNRHALLRCLPFGRPSGGVY
jgi:hypothetical protein